MAKAFVEIARKESHSLSAARKRPDSAILQPARSNQAQRISVQRQDIRPRTLRPRIISFRCGGRRNSGTFNQEGDRGSAEWLAICYPTSVITRRHDSSLLGTGRCVFPLHVAPTRQSLCGGCQPTAGLDCRSRLIIEIDKCEAVAPSNKFNPVDSRRHLLQSSPEPISLQ